jgi:hypothetical protein
MGKPLSRRVAWLLGRRDFLAVSVGLTATFAARLVLGQSAKPNTRAAVVIGVNQAGDLPPLNGAVSGAAMVGDWLSKEGFEVTLITDEDQQQRPVTRVQIFNAIRALVSRGTLEQLVIYFSGHGYISGYSEY